MFIYDNSCFKVRAPPIFSIFILCIGNFLGFYGKTEATRFAMHICLAIFYWNNPFLH